ncbi:hypothetical protein D0810_14840 [Vibrio cholerae]|nr:hypothetical protein [Vibrio cholerae]EGR2283036.1 hypothetical protein [Vibrio cholerae]
MKKPLIARPFWPAISFQEENPYPPLKRMRDTDKIIAYSDATQFVGKFLEKLPRRKNHENNPPSQG